MIKKITVLIVAIFFSISCASSKENQTESPSNENKIQTPSSKDDIAELNSIVRLPYLPEEVTWHEEQNSKNPENKRLVAVMRFSEDDEKALIQQAEKHGQSQPTEIEVEDWFPPELVAQNELSGDETLKGIAYSPTDFIQMPYKKGRLIKIENSHYFVLELSTD
ncbi:MAG: hypothetical protein D6687_05040 [Acidobacteria bacterium]|nr:MAG: hypothetical protein D6687_05040 [Acidobacteriota bacterium]GIU82841.1 MAG: hypothetical protein KatS3mg006_1905 [Pyrinomonadaceae bacterium]